MAFFLALWENPAYSGLSSSSNSGSNFRTQRKSNSNLFCDYYNWKCHTRANCFRLHGYPANWKCKRRTSPGPVTAANFVTGSSPHNINGHLDGSQGSMDDGSSSSSRSMFEG